MIVDIFNEIPWQQFTQLDGINRLPLNEQQIKYNQYLYELSVARHNFITYQNKGPIGAQSGFLQQENLFYILQEDGSRIIIT